MSRPPSPARPSGSSCRRCSVRSKGSVGQSRLHHRQRLASPAPSLQYGHAQHQVGKQHARPAQGRPQPFPIAKSSSARGRTGAIRRDVRRCSANAVSGCQPTTESNMRGRAKRAGWQGGGKGPTAERRSPECYRSTATLSPNTCSSFANNSSDASTLKSSPKSKTVSLRCGISRRKRVRQVPGN